jgi:glycosyltransferase involved in cell wall biosynthesis
MTEHNKYQAFKADEIPSQEISDPTVLSKTPLVSVVMPTYNHESYIAQAIEGALMQKTNFPYEVLIGEDGSSDRTLEICKEYVAKYPDKIRLFLNDRKNVIYINGRPTGRWNFINLLKKSKGKYIALCEGDDYWIDPYKLQKQFDFLERNTDYIICYHDAIIIDENGGMVSDTQLPEKLKRDLTSDELMKAAWVLTLSMFFRNVLHEFPEEYFKVLNADRFLVLLLGPYGKGKYMGGSIKPAAYRIHDSSIWSSLQSDVKRFQNLNSDIYMYQYYLRTGKKDFAIKFLFKRVFKSLALFYLEKNPISKLFLRYLKIIFISKETFFIKLRKLMSVLKIYLKKEK